MRTPVRWREKFLRGPYLREYAIARGVMRETMETAITWERFAKLREHVKSETHRAIREVTGRPGSVTCRFTHIYPDGPAPYFTWFASGNKLRIPEQYMAIKKIAEQAMVDAGGTVTHHHALGRDHRPWYYKERPELFCSAMKAATVSGSCATISSSSSRASRAEKSSSLSPSCAKR